ncbi:MAG TPA: nuclear transport factor 2 family protein [Pyrinomonadaceae bacterium]|nr:nuclear transport factor 2 family protein [Pyrinomonadaceae bacterium]
MKRIILLASLLLAASACTTSTQAPSNTNTSATPANTNAAATPRAETNPSADSNITAQEKQIWEEIKQNDADGFAAMLADDFVYVSSDGVYDKAGTVAGIKGLAVTDVSLSDWRTAMIGDDAAVVTYTVSMKGTSGGQPIPATPVRAGSVWVNRGGKWLGVFHQETESEPMPTDATPAGKDAAAKATPAAESKPAEPASDDPVAREKQVWDALKKKDYDRFASLLADDQIEVFAWGVNDKAGSVEGVKQVDLSSGVLSDFKTIKISDDATAVTYMVKGSGSAFSPNGARASSVWAKRDGKWLAVYHQDTTIKPAAAKK